MTRFLLLLSTLLLALTGCTRAHAESRVGLTVIDRDTGQSLPQYRHLRERWIAGLPGHRYALQLTNHTPERVLVVLSVDGVNAVTGQTAHPSQGGYVLDPWETTEIAGWRKSLDEVAQFVFTDVGDSYAARTDRPRNVGVIGIAVFTERHYPRYSRVIVEDEAKASRRSEAEASAPSSAAEMARDANTQTLGTGHGAREWSQVGSTEFERADTVPVQVTELRYDTPRRLMAKGVLPRKRVDAPVVPRAFPQGFVPDPPAGRAW